MVLSRFPGSIFCSVPALALYYSGVMLNILSLFGLGSGLLDVLLVSGISVESDGWGVACVFFCGGFLNLLHFAVVQSAQDLFSLKPWVTRHLAHSTFVRLLFPSCVSGCWACGAVCSQGGCAEVPLGVNVLFDVLAFCDWLGCLIGDAQ